MIENLFQILSSKPHNIHFLKRYVKFIHHCQSINTSIDVYEKHHILPKANDMFPEYKSFRQYRWNKINLTPKQHYIAHHLLWKTFPNTSMVYAFKCISNGQSSKNHKRFTKHISAKQYAKLKTENAEYNSKRNKGKVSVRNLITGETSKVTSDEFRTNPDLVAVNKGVRRPMSESDKARLRKPKNELTKAKMRKPKSEAHANKIRAHLQLNTIPIVCCLVNKKEYNKSNWTRHYKLLYEDGYAEKISASSSNARKGKIKSVEHLKNLSASLKLKREICRVCDIFSRKEYSVQSFMAILNRKIFFELNGFNEGDVCCIKTKKVFNKNNAFRVSPLVAIN